MKYTLIIPAATLITLLYLFIKKEYRRHKETQAMKRLLDSESVPFETGEPKGVHHTVEADQLKGINENLKSL